MRCQSESTVPTPALCLQFGHAHQSVAASGMPGEGGHPLASIEIADGRDHSFAFGFRVGEPHGIQKFLIWNIDSRLHDGLNDCLGFPIDTYCITSAGRLR